MACKDRACHSSAAGPQPAQHTDACAPLETGSPPCGEAEGATRPACSLHCLPVMSPCSCSNPFAQQVGATAGTAAVNAATEQAATSARTGAFGAWGGGMGSSGAAASQSTDYPTPALNGGAGGGGDLAAREAQLARREAELSQREAQLASATAQSGGVIKVGGGRVQGGLFSGMCVGSLGAGRRGAAAAAAAGCCAGRAVQQPVCWGSGNKAGRGQLLPLPAAVQGGLCSGEGLHVVAIMPRCVLVTSGAVPTAGGAHSCTWLAQC